MQRGWRLSADTTFVRIVSIGGKGDRPTGLALTIQIVATRSRGADAGGRVLRQLIRSSLPV